MVNEAADEYDP